MGTWAAVGKSTVRRALHAGREAAEKALAGLPERKADAALVFATAGFDQGALLQGVREVLGDLPLAGCSGEGIITAEGSDETAHAVAVMALASDRATFEALHVQDYAKDPTACAAVMAEHVREAGPKRAKVLLLFPDGITGSCSTFLRALHERLPFPVVVAGGTAGEVMKLDRTYQYGRAAVSSDSISALLIGGDIVADVTVSHGCDPLGLPRTVTRSDGARVFEIDGKGAWDAFKEYLVGDPEDLTGADVVHLCVGEQLPKSMGQDGLIIRTPLSLDKSDGSLFFPGGLAQGAAIQMTRRDPERIKLSAAESARELKARRPEQKPALVFQFDCAGRGRVLFGDQASENAVTPLQHAVGEGVPWLGFHTYGEIAQLQGVPYFHNYSVVLCALYDS